MDKEKLVMIAGAGAIGLGLMYAMKKQPTVQDIEVGDVKLFASDAVPEEYTASGTVVYEGDYCAAELTWKNKGSESIAPKWRMDIRPPKIGDTWLEGKWIPSSSTSGGAQSKVIVFCEVGKGWTPGTKIDVKIMLEGIRGEVWGPKFNEGSDAFTVGEPVHAISIISVTPLNSGIIKPGEVPRATVVWKNTGYSAYAPKFRFDIKESGGNWKNGDVLQITEKVAPQQTAQAEVFGKVIPLDWGTGTNVYAKLMTIGIEGATWDSGIAVYSVVGAKSEFDSLVASYNDNPVGTKGISIENGQFAQAKITFRHKGGQGTFAVGVALKYPPSPKWLNAGIEVDDDLDWQSYEADVAGLWDTTLGDGATVDVLKFIQVLGGPLDIGGNGFLLADWDPDAYRNTVAPVEASQFRNLQASYNGLPIGATAEIRNGEWAKVTIFVEHKGEGGFFDVGVGLKYSPNPKWIYGSTFFDDDPDWAQYEVSVAGLWDTTLAPGREVETLKFVQVKDGPRDIGGEGFLLADWDWGYRNI